MKPLLLFLLLLLRLLFLPLLIHLLKLQLPVSRHRNMPRCIFPVLPGP